MTAMDFLPSDLEHMNTNFLDMIESEANSHLLDIDNLNSDKLNDIINGDMMHDSGMEFDNEDMNNSNWFHSLQWNDSSKVPQSLIDASNEVENNNPNLLVNPQSVLPMHSMQQVQNNNPIQQMNKINTRNVISVKINGQDAVLTPTNHPQIQYVTVQNITSINNSQIGYTVQPISICAQQLHSVGTITSPSLTSPVLVEHLQNGTQTQILNINNNKVRSQQLQDKVYPKPVYSYSCLIAMALKNSKTGNLPVSEIYNFMIDNFPYFKTAPDGWKNSVRHNLSLNKCFAKVDTGKPTGQHTRKGCLWALNPAKIEKMEEEIVKWRKKDPESVKLSMSKPENLELIEQGKAGPPRHSNEELSSPVKQPDPVIPMHVTPIKARNLVSNVVRACNGQVTVITREAPALNPKLEPEINVTDVNPYDPPMSGIGVQTNLWEDELSISVGNNTNNSMMSPVGSPSYNGNQYHGNITYTCMSPQTARSPVPNMTPTKLYTQTPTKIYPQTPSKLVFA
ncbi:forkhead box protein N4-like [Dreissena polymorpha]|uniref:Fork-head domain-containing protein n=1 Tax=Dreissena polymorpha TaxID=45954 RepID=A0A9D4RST2_DREPO|nr:forkhead box protein N4-like [Dreissena polymorpha]KAH3877440.1 hypothetical protein DPMN_001307 [Dreissena polymorpha]